MMALLVLTLALAACATPPDTSSAETLGPIAHGQALATRYCSSCHAVGRSDESHHKEAIPFRDLSELYPVDSIEESLVEGLMSGHPDMPEFQFSDQAAADFVEYLASIQRR
jgi:mono/diheme cytochrome c family protein